MDTGASLPIAVRIETAAHLMDTSPATVLYWIRQGRLHATKVGKSYRVRVEDLDGLLTPKAAAS